MSKDIENKVVSMEFDNSKFEKPAKQTLTTLDKLKQALGFDGVEKGFKQIQKAISAVTFTPIEKGIDSIYAKFTFMERFTIQMYDRLANKIINIGQTIAKETFSVPIGAGKTEYEQKMGAVQTIMASSKKSLEEVNAVLAELNKYADDTIYSFSDMTQSIGKFTNAGVDLQDAVAAIKGVSNEAALSGANANEASRAMYNFAQALSTGSVKLIDWKSIENANMATVEFKNELLKTAAALGTVANQTEGVYKTQKGTVVSATRMFNDSLSEQWLTSEVLVETLKKYSNVEEDVGRRATAAATEVKTFTMLMDTLKEALQSGWAESWEYIFGDFNQAKKLWTDVSNVLGDLIERMSTARNTLLKFWSEFGGRTSMLNGISRMWKNLVTILGTVRDAFRSVFPPMTGQGLISFTQSFERLAKRLQPSISTITYLRKAFRGVFSVIAIGVDAVKALYNVLTPLVGTALKYLFGHLTKTSATFGDWLTQLRQTIKEGKVFETVFGAVGKVLSFLGKAFAAVFETITGILSAFKVDGFKAGLTAIKDGFANLLKSIWNLIKEYNPITAIYNLGVKMAAAISEWPIGAAIIGVITSVKNAIVNSPVWRFCVAVVTGFVDAIQAAINKLRHVDTSATEDFTNNVKTGFGPLEFIKKFFVTIWNGICAVFETVGPVLTTVGKTIKTAFGTLFSSIKGVVDRSNMSDVGIFGAGTGLGVVLISLANFVSKLAATIKNTNGILGGLKLLFKDIGQLLEAFRFEAYAKSVKSIAVAIALLAGSLFVLAALPADAIARATGAIMLLFNGLIKSMNAFAALPVIKGEGGEGGKGVAGGLLSIGLQMMMLAGAISILVANMLILALVPYEAIVKGLGTLALMIRMVSAEAIKMSSQGGKGNTLGALIGLGVFFQLLMVPLAVLSAIAYMNPLGLAGAVGAVVILILTLTGAMALITGATSKWGDKTISVGKPMLAMAAALMGIVSALVVLTTIATIIAKLDASSALSQATTAILKIMGMLILLAAAMAGIATLGGLFASTGYVTKTKQANGKTTSNILERTGKVPNIIGPVLAALLGIGAAMIAISVAMAVVVAAIKILDPLEFGMAIDALLAITAALGMIAALSSVMSKTSTKFGNIEASAKVSISIFPKLASYILSAAMLVVSIAAAAKVISMVSNRDLIWTVSILGGFIAAVMAMAFMTTGSKKKKNASDALIKIAKAFSIFAQGAMFLSIGVGIIVAALALLAKSTGGEVDKFADNLDRMTEALRTRKDSIVAAVGTLVQMVIEAFVQGLTRGITTAINEIADLLINTIHAIVERGPEIISEIFLLIDQILDGIASKAPETTEKLVVALVSVISGLAAAIHKHSSEIVEAINSAMEAVLEVILGLFARLFGVSKDNISKFVDDIMPHAKRVATVLIGMFAISKMKSAADGALAVLEAFKIRFSKIAGAITGSLFGKAEYQRISASKLFGEDTEALTKWLEKHKNDKGFTSGTWVPKDEFDEYKKYYAQLQGTPGLINKIKSAISGGIPALLKKTQNGIKGIFSFLETHPKIAAGVAVAATAVIAKCIAKIIDASTEAIEVTNAYDDEATDVYNRMIQKEREYQTGIENRKNAMEEAAKVYDKALNQTDRLDAMIDADGKIIDGKQKQFDLLVEQYELGRYINIDEDGRVELIDGQNNKLEYQKDLLEDILKRERLMSQLKTVSDQAEDERMKLTRGDYAAEIVAAEKAVTDFGSRVDNRIGKIAKADFTDYTNDALRSIYSQYKQLVASGMSSKEASRKLGWTIEGTDKSSTVAEEKALQKILNALNSVEGEHAVLEQAVNDAHLRMAQANATVIAYDNALEKATGDLEEFAEAMNALQNGYLTSDSAAYLTGIQKEIMYTKQVTDALVKYNSAKALYNQLGQEMPTDMREELERSFRNAADLGLDAGIDMGNALAEGLRLGVSMDNLEPWMVDYFDEHAYEAVKKKSFNSNSPSKKYEQLGVWNVLGLIKGTAKKEGELEKAYTAMGATSIAAWTAAMSEQTSIPWVPLLDTSGIQNGSNSLQNRLAGMQIGTIGTSVTSQLAASVDTSSLDIDNSKIVGALGDVLTEVSTLKDVIANLKVVMDSGTLVGELTPGIDMELGRRAVRKGRGV